MLYIKYMKCLLSIFLLFLLAPASGNSASSPLEKDWDRILDKYETLCDECADLKLRAAAGEKVSRSSFNKLVSALKDLRQELREGSGTMSAAQRARFDRIRSRYASMFGESSQENASEAPVRIRTVSDKGDKEETGKSGKSAGPVVKPSGSNVKSEPVVKKSLRDSLPIDPPANLLPPSNPAPAILSSQENISLAIHYPIVDYTIPKTTAARQKILDYSICACAGVYPELSYGAVFSMMSRKNRWGGYLKYRSNFKSRTFSYECSSDGSCSSGQIWSSGNTSVCLMNVSAGARKNFGKWVGVYAGAGYGRYVSCWEDIDGNWAKVADISVSGLSLECGAVLDFGPVEIQAGVATVMFRYTGLEICLGFRF